MGKNKNAGKPRNYALECGVYRFGKGKMYHKKAIYKFNKKAAPVKAATPKPTFVEKPVKGAKNGETRMVRVKRLRNDVPTIEKKPAGTSVNFFSKHKRSLRPTLTPGKICILLAGAHKGKRVVVLKQLASGLVLITGPMKLNGCPMRRVNQIYLLATATEVDISAVALPETINDDYFKHAKAEKVKKAEGDIFTSKKEEYKPSEQRKADQDNVDKQMLEAIKKHPEAASLKSYFKATFMLSKGRSSRFRSYVFEWLDIDGFDLWRDARSYGCRRTYLRSSCWYLLWNGLPSRRERHDQQACPTHRYPRRGRSLR
jgi:large subunit ribosomal protein L6e